MERPALVNIPDFFIIGLMSLLFLIMLGVIGEAIMTYQGMRKAPAKTSGAGA